MELGEGLEEPNKVVDRDKGLKELKEDLEGLKDVGDNARVLGNSERTLRVSRKSETV